MTSVPPCWRGQSNAGRRFGATVTPQEVDVTRLDFPDNHFDAAVTTFLFCVLPDDLQVPALRELGLVVKRGGSIRLLEYVQPQGAVRQVVARSSPIP